MVDVGKIVSEQGWDGELMDEDQYGEKKVMMQWGETCITTK